MKQYLIMLFCVMISITSVFSEEMKLTAEKDQKIVEFSIHDFAGVYENVYLVGQWNETGYQDGTYSDFIELNDAGEQFDRTADDNIFNMRIALQTGQSYFVLVFADTTSMAPENALSVQEFNITDSNETQSFDIIPYKQADFKITVNLEDREIPELFFYCNWDKNFNISKDFIQKKYRLYDDGTNGDAKAEDRIFSYMFFGYSIPEKPVYRVKIFDGKDPASSSLVAERALDQSRISNGILALSAVDQASVTFIFDDSREKRFDTVFALGSWDKAGNFDTKYSEDFIVMNKDADNMFKLQRDLSVSPERYTILYFQDDTSKIPSDAIDIKYFEVNNTDTQEIVTVFPKFTDDIATVAPASQQTLQYVTIICVIFIIIAVILTYSFSYGKFMKKTAELGGLFAYVSKHPIISLGSISDKNVQTDMALNIAYEYIKKYSYSAAIITDTDQEYKKEFEAVFSDSDKYKDYLHVVNELVFKEKELTEKIDTVEDVDVIIFITNKSFDAQANELLHKLYSEFSLPMFVISDKASVKDDSLTKCFTVSVSEAKEYEQLQLKCADAHEQFIRNKKTKIMRKKF